MGDISFLLMISFASTSHLLDGFRTGLIVTTFRLYSTTSFLTLSTPNYRDARSVHRSFSEPHFPFLCVRVATRKFNPLLSILPVLQEKFVF
jgi:hypothetical protein